MLRRLWQWLKRFFQGLFGNKHPSPQPGGQRKVEPPKQPTDAEYEALFLELLAGVNEGWSRGRVKGFLDANKITQSGLVEWLRRFGERLLASSAPNDELAARMVQVGELGVGEVGDVARDIGMRLLRRGGETNRQDAKDAEERGEGEAEAWFDRGNEQFMAGDFAGAIASYDKAVEFKPGYHESWHNRGVMLSNLGRIEDAITSYDKAVEFKPDDHEAWYNRGVALFNLGRFEEAIASYDKAVEFKPDYYEAWNNRGLALGNLGRFEEAIASYDKAIKFKPDLHQPWINRGNAAGSSVSCDPLLAFMSAIARQNPLLNQRGYEGQLASYKEGLKYCHQDTHPEGWGQLHRAIGNAHYFRGRKDSRPRSYWHKAVNSYNEALKTLTEADFPQLHLEVLQDLIRVLLALEETAKASELQRRGTDLLRRLLNECKSPGNKKQLALKFAPFQQLTVDLAVQSGDLVQAVELAEQGKNACLSWLLYAWSDEISSPSYLKMQRLLNPKTAIIYWHLSPAALHTFILKHDAPSPILLSSPPFSSRVGGDLQSDELEVPAAVQRLHDFENWVKDWNQQYADYRDKKDEQSKSNHSWRVDMENRLNDLKKILSIPTIKQELQDITHLILIPHRDLHRFPLHALFNGQGEGLNFTIAYLPSAQIGINLQEFSPKGGKEGAQQLLSVEAPTSKGLKSLNFAFFESEAISLMFDNPKRIQGKEATKEQVENVLEDGYEIFHFTGHGKYNFIDPKKSELALAGEDKLTLEEIFQKSLTTYNLVSLSACETAITGNQTITTEYVGLVSGFLCRGVANVVSTLWTVESAASALVMIEFYHRRQPDKSDAIALVEATEWLKELTVIKLKLWYEDFLNQLPDEESKIRPFLETEVDKISKMESDKKLYKHPYYWAAFIITGKQK
ncbi:CHAT domain-containing protein [Scytonema sp. PCC 10023]|uniref:CHAT domain-containing protein n=1 Tax=Scytonema sp. PCC 10023 TaxID=1680591 RepID=UPI0039C6EA15